MTKYRYRHCSHHGGNTAATASALSGDTGETKRHGSKEYNPRAKHPRRGVPLRLVRIPRIRVMHNRAQYVGCENGVVHNNQERLESFNRRRGMGQNGRGT